MLKGYSEIDDIIIFGSAVKGKDHPKDIDIAVLAREKSPELHNRLKKELDDEKIHLEMIRAASLFKTRLSLNVLLEGFSIRENRYFSEMLGIRPVKLFIYHSIGFSRSKKAMFSMALTKTIKQIGGRRIAPGAVLIPIHKSSYFNEFLDTWQIKYKTEEYSMF